MRCVIYMKSIKCLLGLFGGGWLNLGVGSSNLKMQQLRLKIRKLLQTDARFTARQLTWLTTLSLACAHGFLKKHLQLRKINVRWIPHLLMMSKGRPLLKMPKSNCKCTHTLAKRLLTIYSLVQGYRLTFFHQEQAGPLKQND